MRWRIIKNIIIGIDGGCFESIILLLKNKKLPNFNRIIKNGFSAPLKVTVPHATIPSWPCLFSGLDVEGLGYYTFIHPLKGIFNSSVWRDKSIFSINEMKIFALNVPGTYPAWKINGEMITGILSPSVSCYPKELEFLINKYWIIEGEDIPEIFKAFGIKKRMFLQKMKEDFNLMVYVIRLPDAISHRVKGGKKKIIELMNLGYEKIDEFIGEVLAMKNFDNLIIFSDHGLKFYKKTFYISRWLEKKRLLFLNAPMRKKFNNLLLKLFDIIRPIVNIEFSKKAFKQFFKKRERRLRPYKHAEFFDKENPRTFIQMLTSNMGAIFLFGKDKDNLEDVKSKMKNDKHFKKVYEFKAGGFPDLLVALKDEYIFDPEPSFFIKRKTESFNHSSHGFFIAFGKDIKNGQINIVDYRSISPTILKVCKVEIPDYMKGKPLDIFKNN
ncbi:MAG: alkaline phosphatase family protein [Promethearchaeota archaeon]